MLEQYTAKLVPVSEWNFYLYRVTYWRVDQDVHSPHKTKYLVSTDTHIDGEVQEAWPSDWYVSYTYEEVCEVQRPLQIGTIHGCRISESAVTAGAREARAHGLTTEGA